MWFFLRLPFGAAAYFEWTARHPRFWQVEREGREVLLWIGRLHVILTLPRAKVARREGPEWTPEARRRAFRVVE